MITGTNVDDTLIGTSGCGSGNDQIFGGSDNDILTGACRKSIIYSEDTNYTLEKRSKTCQILHYTPLYYTNYNYTHLSPVKICDLVSLRASDNKKKFDICQSRITLYIEYVTFLTVFLMLVYHALFDLFIHRHFNFPFLLLKLLIYFDN